MSWSVLDSGCHTTSNVHVKATVTWAAAPSTLSAFSLRKRGLVLNFIQLLCGTMPNGAHQPRHIAHRTGVDCMYGLGADSA